MKEEKYLTDKELKEVCKEYTIKLLELQKIRIKCINLGISASKEGDLKTELILIDKSIEMLKGKKK